MKKIAFLLIPVLSLTLLHSSFASAQDAPAQITDPAVAIAFYESVVSSPEWQTTVSRAERGNMVQLPEDMLSSMDTPALTEAVLEYPFFWDIYAFDDMQMGIDTMFETFNGVRELAQREDAGEVLLQKYMAEEVITDSQAETLESSKVVQRVVRLSNLESLLAQECFLQKMDHDQLETLKEVVAEKYFVKCSSSEYGGFDATFYKLIGNEEFFVNSAGVNVLDSKGYVYTPNGSEVAVDFITRELSADAKIEMNNRYAVEYPDATLLRSATCKYNCHSYAWYSQSSSNNVWMNDPSAYWNDNSYTYRMIPNAGYKMVWYRNGHSGIVESVSDYIGPPSSAAFFAPFVTVVSKWGEYGLYRHSGDNSPYSIAQVSFYYR